MNEDELIIICGLIFVFFTIAFLIVLNKKQKNSINHLEDEIISLKEKNFDQEVNANKNNAVTRGNFTIEQIKKIESLEYEIKKQKKRVKDAKSMVAEAYQVKTKFLSNIQEEVRDPINSIIISSETLVKNIKENRYNASAKNILQSGKKLLEWIDDTIELSSVESGAFTFEEKPVNLKNLLENTVNRRIKEAHKKGLELSLILDDSFPQYVMIDASRVEEITNNLIENAIKFTNRGYVVIKLSQNGKSILKNSINIVFTVEDSGIGIKEQEQRKIFEIDKTTTNMGLALNKKIAKRMNGNISLKSEESQGSTFIFTMADVEVVLPSEETQKTSLDRVDFSLINSKSGAVIVIDSDAKVRSAVRNSFLESSFKVFSFDNPRDAIEELKSTNVDMILIDVDILTSDENAVSKILKGISHAPVVTLTDKRLKDIKFSTSGARVVGHLRKPLVQSELFKISLQVLNS